MPAAWRLAADLATVGVFALGLGATAVRADEGAALALVGLAMALDGLDGALARRAGGPTRHGAALDAVADLAAFGLAPVALVLGAAGRHPSSVPALELGGAADLLALCAFLAAASVRLARAARRGPRTEAAGYRGLPMPAAASLLLGLTLALDVRPWLAAAVVAWLAIGARPYPTPRELWRVARPPVLAIGLIAAAAATTSPAAAMLLAAVPFAAWPWWRAALLTLRAGVAHFSGRPAARDAPAGPLRRS